METIPVQHLPNAFRCALEMFAASGDRTKARLMALIDHYLKACGLAEDPHRSVYEECAVAHAKRMYSLGAAQGF
ncbi:hypothetical protein ACUXAV_005004 [Cupriavidus metallidurans]|jgi:hypothetical protein|uniref:Uncharacterized protein n=2 Tax=Cupriavidus TaxID=106589 RepID=A0A3G8GVT1_9BURK|nr:MULTISPECIES: hypothetical protein [Cupriavidus]AZG12090.1 hypothetical protein EHF44_01010 [Cupriavidus pauculus]MCA3183482.1 hypothetical protein [Cupriavidus sp.]MCA3192190.1 hypothetical protein [Cupriavidus sp.]MCA3233352.1 hypothetical protein [Cupriavidus sp.]MDE4922615.1 hypothetical protein [Cupriavidus metallidurans]